MRSIISLILIILCASCAKKEVQLPQTTNTDIIDILDVSPIYMFYNEDNDSIEFNRRNMISTTNWLVNIDKRLTLKQILPHLQYLQEKRHGDGMHKNENAKNYFTCHNTEIQNLSFIEFTDLEFKQDSLFSSKLPQAIKSSTKQVSFLDHQSFYFDNNKYRIDTLHSVLNKLSKTHSNIKTLTLRFKENLIYQDYITIKTKILDLDLGTITISNNEIIYK